jgi:hypothetical protein
VQPKGKKCHHQPADEQDEQDESEDIKSDEEYEVARITAFARGKVGMSV